MLYMKYGKIILYYKNEMDKYSQQNTELKVLELFAGNRSFGKICDSYGIKTCSTDLYQCKEKNIHMVKNFLEMKIEDIPFIPDVIWASPPCTAFSVASSGHHF
jgi:site-specific DNA-cytosine methylase